MFTCATEERSKVVDINAVTTLMTMCYDVRPTLATESWRSPCSRRAGLVDISRVSDAAHRQTMAMVIPTMNPKGGRLARRRHGGMQTGVWDLRGARQGGRWPCRRGPQTNSGGAPRHGPRGAKRGGREQGPAVLTWTGPNEDREPASAAGRMQAQRDAAGHLLRERSGSGTSVSGPLRFSAYAVSGGWNSMKSR